MDTTDQALKDDAGLGDGIDWVARARALRPVIEGAAERIEADRKVTADVMAAIHEAGLFRLCLPRSLGGAEAPPRTTIEVIEAVASADASTAWCLGQGLGCSFSAGYLEPAAARDVFGPPDAVLAWGPASPGSKAVAVDGGYRVTGKWNFASGGRNATWFGAHCPLFNDDGSPQLDASGAPALRTLVFPASSVTMTDVWHVMGLCGTGSDSYAVDDLFVPTAYSFIRDSAESRRESFPLYRYPVTMFYAMAFAGVALGIARSALGSYIGLAAEKSPRMTGYVLRENPRVQADVAMNEAKIAAARAWLMEMVDLSWDAQCSGRDLTLDERARIRIACTYANVQSREVVEYAYYAAGATAIFRSNPFERRFRDMHAVSQQIQGQMSNFEQAGMALLGLAPKGGRV